jgi:hypothetical protein
VTVMGIWVGVVEATEIGSDVGVENCVLDSEAEGWLSMIFGLRRDFRYDSRIPKVIVKAETPKVSGFWMV